MRAVLVAVPATAVVAACGSVHADEPDRAGIGAGALASAGGAAHCDRYASPEGGRKQRGTRRDPYRGAQALVDHLRAGRTGCLRRGSYREDVTFRRGGRPGRPIVLTSAPGGGATIRGIVWVADTANDVVLSRLRLDASTTGDTPSVQVNGDRVVFRGNDVTNRHTGICFALGGAFAEYGMALSVRIDRNRIHDCGRLPATRHDHGIYAEGTRDLRITRNLIHGNADWGVHLYPDADGTYVAHNVIDGNGGGVIVAGEEGGEYAGAFSSDRNTIEHNVIANGLRYSDLETSWGGPVGVGNVARLNCLGPAAAGPVGDDAGLSITRNTVARPAYVDRAGGDLRLRRNTRCARIGAGL